MMSLVNKSADWPPNYHKILIFFPTKIFEKIRIDELADSNKPAIMTKSSIVTTGTTHLDIVMFPVLVAESTFSLLPLGRYLLLVSIPILCFVTIN